MTEPDFLDLEDVLALHERQIEAFGGTLGIRDQGLLESALAMPRASFGGEYVHGTIFAMAAAYALHIAGTSRSWTETSGPAWAPRSCSCGSLASGSPILRARSTTP